MCACVHLGRVLHVRVELFVLVGRCDPQELGFCFVVPVGWLVGRYVSWLVGLLYHFCSVIAGGAERERDGGQEAGWPLATCADGLNGRLTAGRPFGFLSNHLFICYIYICM